MAHDPTHTGQIRTRRSVSNQQNAEKLCCSLAQIVEGVNVKQLPTRTQKGTCRRGRSPEFPFFALRQVVPGAIMMPSRPRWDMQRCCSGFLFLALLFTLTIHASAQDA